MYTYTHIYVERERERYLDIVFNLHEHGCACKYACVHTHAQTLACTDAKEGVKRRKEVLKGRGKEGGGGGGGEEDSKEGGRGTEGNDCAPRRKMEPKPISMEPRMITRVYSFQYPVVLCLSTSMCMYHVCICTCVYTLSLIVVTLTVCAIYFVNVVFYY